MPRNRPLKPNTDPPGVADVRRWRAKLTKQAGGTLEGLVALARETAANAEQKPRSSDSRAAVRKPTTGKPKRHRA